MVGIIGGKLIWCLAVKGPSTIADQFKNSNSVRICSDPPTHPSNPNRNASGIFHASTQGRHVSSIFQRPFEVSTSRGEEGGGTG